MITRFSNVDISYSTVEAGNVRRIVATVQPQNGLADPIAQLDESLHSLANLTQEQDGSDSIVRQAIFLADPTQLTQYQQYVQDFFGRQMPATSYILQAPSSGKAVAIEAETMIGLKSPVEIDRRSHQLVIARHDGRAWCFCENVGGTPVNGSLHSGALATFDQMHRLLGEAGFQFTQVIRTWLYLGNITGKEADIVRYHELNRARVDFYSDIPFPHFRINGHSTTHRFYPASTGIGAQGDHLVMSCVALADNHNQPTIVPLENPNQTAACSYDKRFGEKSPSFSRAVAVVADDVVTVFISGTASITGAESRHIGNIAAQTHQTLDNIASLIGPANFKEHGIPGHGATLADLTHVRVYLKHAADHSVVQTVCRDRLGDVPILFTVADICRPELLVEIEASAVVPCR